ncbi:uncharacterized protein [Amphiura filiformis]|uniref:uncharacterized protein n=1 Tax=Amphiura filiformis TaxID=82378 RepID=UPI003B223E44
MMPPQQQAGVSQIGGRLVPGVKCLSISILVIGVIIAGLGIICIVLRTHMSYVANPVWSGLLFLVITGAIGLFVHQQRDNQKIRIAFLVMCIISSVCAFQLMWTVWGGALLEWLGCIPSRTLYDAPCISPTWTRVLFGVIIGFLALAAFVLCIVSCSVTIYGTCKCCYECCGGAATGSPAMVQYSTNSGVVVVPVDGQGMQVMSTPQIIPPASQQTISVSQNAPPSNMASSTVAPVSSTMSPSITNEQQTSEKQGLIEIENTLDDKPADERQNWETFS